MNESANHDELPELTDEDIELLHEICRRANRSPAPPFKALFSAYQDVFAEENIDPEHDPVIFRLLLRIGEPARAAATQGQEVDFVDDLKHILEAHGITLVDVADNDPSEAHQSTRELPLRPKVKQAKPERRRVSFDDARLEETWLSEPGGTPTNVSMYGRDELLRMPPIRGRGISSPRKARSTSPPRHHIARYPAPKHQKLGSTPSDNSTELSDFAHPQFHIEPSHTQLEQNADAFLSTSAIRTARRCLGVLRDKALDLEYERTHAENVAEAHDRATLLRQSLNALRASFADRRQVREAGHQHERLSRQAQQNYERRLLQKAFTHWQASAQDQRDAVERAKKILLQIRYFKRWRAITVENNMKSRSILTRKFLNIWRERSAQRHLRLEQAEAHFEEMRMKQCFQALFWEFCSRRVDLWHEERIMRRAFQMWSNKVQTVRARAVQAEQHYNRNLCQDIFQVLRDRLAVRDQQETIAIRFRSTQSIKTAFDVLRRQSALQPLLRQSRQQADVKLRTKAIKVWNLHLSLNKKAVEGDRKRILQSAWTSWNDALRCRVLSQRIDERVLVESLYRWVLQERLSLFRKKANGNVRRKVFVYWHEKARERQAQLDEAAAIFEENQTRRRAASAMRQLNIVMRKREDDERAGLEFRNSKLLPRVLEPWTAQTYDLLLFNRWAADARYYVLCTRAIRIWKAKTIESQHHRKRQAYAHIRSRVKLRLARTCFGRWHDRALTVVEMNKTAGERHKAGIVRIGTNAFDQMVTMAGGIKDMDNRAAELDRQRLLGSALTALMTRRTEFERMERQATEFQRESDLALMASALRRMQWHQFTAARRKESAEALWARNRDMHIRQMIRLWAHQAQQKQEARERVHEEPESPSLRPASRAASRSSSQRIPYTSPRGKEPSTPAYLRTPSRVRKAGRFRPLPTPAPMTPFAFDASYLSTTPASVPVIPRSSGMPSMLLAPLEQSEFDTSLSPQVTPFERKLRAGGIVAASTPALRSSVFGRSINAGGGGTAKSVRFARGSRFGIDRSRSNVA